MRMSVASVASENALRASPGHLLLQRVAPAWPGRNCRAGEIQAVDPWSSVIFDTPYLDETEPLKQG